jgi:hypothetical protein
MELGAIGTLKEWQNLYPRREIMVLGMGLKGEAKAKLNIGALFKWGVKYGIFHKIGQGK